MPSKNIINKTQNENRFENEKGKPEMTDKHDFKAALEKLETKGRVKTLGSEFFFSTEECLTIQSALRIADRLQSGEVSEFMAKKGAQEFYGGRSNTPEGVFKAMAAQMIKEENQNEQIN